MSFQYTTVIVYFNYITRLSSFYEIQDIYHKMFLFIGIIAYIILCIVLFVLLSDSPPHIRQFSRLGQKRNVLFVTSHPDDECMFFSPTIIRLVENGHKVRLLCLSSGDYYGQGQVRKHELVESCVTLGIPRENVEIIHDDHLPDDPNHTWDPERILYHVYHRVKQHSINTVITFDENGVSGHYNHKQTYRAFWRAMFFNKLPQGLDVFVLESTNVLRKYISILDLPLSLLLCRSCIFILNWEEICRCHLAMHKHQSQMVWFRQLYLWFSRYMVINTLKPLELQRPRKPPPSWEL